MAIFEFADVNVWPQQQLEERSQYLKSKIASTLGERSVGLTQELSYVAYEMDCRASVGTVETMPVTAPDTTSLIFSAETAQATSA